MTLQRILRPLLLLTAAAVMLMPFSPVLAANPIDLDLYKGKVVVLDFWASWCVPCRRSFPWLNEMHAKYSAEGLVVIGVNLDNERTEAEEFLGEFSPDFSIVYDADKELAREYEVVAMPSSYVIARDGTVAARHLGFKVKNQTEYEAAIVAALRNQGSTE